jgi:hypothetical protein
VPEWRPTCLRAVLEGHAPNGLVCTVSHNQVIAANLDDQLGADGRAGIEPLIAELKGAFGIGKVPSADFDANHAALLIKLLSHNLLRRYAIDCAPALAARRAPWIRRALIEGPGRFGRHGRSFRLRLAPRPHLIN